MQKTMQIELTDSELGLCIGALEETGKELKEGAGISKKLGTGDYDYLLDLAIQVENLRAKFLKAVGLQDA